MKFSVRMLILELLALIVLIAIAGGCFLTWRLSKGPLDISILKPQIEAALTRARGGQAVSIESLALAWSPDKKRIEATVSGIKTFTAEHELYVEAKNGAVWFETAALLHGKFNIVKLRLEDGVTALHRDELGQWKIVPPQMDVFSETAKPKEDVKPLMADWRGWIPQFRSGVASQSFQNVEFSNFDMRLTDSITGLDWRSENLEGIWTANKVGLNLDISGDLEGLDAPKAVQLRFFSNPSIEDFSVELGIVGADPARLAALITKENYAVKYDGVVDMNVGATANEKDGLLTAQISAAGEGGKISHDTISYSMKAFSFESLLDFKSRQIDFPQVNLKTEKLEGNFSGWANVKEFFDGSEYPKIPFGLNAENVWLEIMPMFSSAWDIDEVDMSGVVDTENLTVDLASVSGSLPDFNATGAGRVYLEPKILLNESDTPKPFIDRLGIEANATGSGRVTLEQVLKFWPVNLGKVARDWTIESILDGRVTGLSYEMNFPPGTVMKESLPDKALTLNFEVVEAKVKILEDLPPVENAVGKGILRGNSLTVELDSGSIGGWNLETGTVDLPAFHPSGSLAVYTASGFGDIKAAMGILEGTRLKTCSSYGLACNRMNGQGAVDVVIKRPMKEGTKIEDMIFEVSGGFVDSKIPDLSSGFGLDKTDITFQLDNKGIEIKGAGRFGKAPTEFTWKQLFNVKKGTSLKANALVSPDIFNALGLAARSILQGEADVQLEAHGDGRNFDSIDMHVDLTGAAINLSEIGWLKPLYVPATGEIRYGRGVDGDAVLTGDIDGKGLKLAGEITFNGKQGLQRATIERIYSEGRMDMRGDLSRSANGDVKINVSGPFLDASPWVDGISQLNGSGFAPGVNVSAIIAVDKLKLREASELLNSRIVLELNPQKLERGLVSGTIARGKGVEATFEREGDDIAFQLRSDDAGYVLQTLMNTEYLIGGSLSMRGVMGKNLGTAEMNLKNVTLKGAPILAQVFALASLRGLTDVLNGDGVFFTEIEAPVRFVKGRIELPGVRASGPAMGLTTRGWFNLDKDKGEINLDGVVVPSFGVNSALGGIPIIGDLFVSRQGEGVFAVTYSVRGPLERARVSINPLSAVTPGFLRRIMENPSKEPEDTPDN